MIRLLTTVLALSAIWLSPIAARVQWTGPGSLYVNGALYATYPRDASYTIDIGNNGSLDAAYRPRPGSEIVIIRPDGAKETATLGARPVYVPWVGR